LLQRGWIFVSEPAREIVVERDDPACAHHGGVADCLQIALAGHHGLGRRQIAQPQRRIAPGSHGADKTSVRVDPGGAGWAGFGSETGFLAFPGVVRGPGFLGHSHGAFSPFFGTL